jgi:hypothetical protein
MSTWVRGHAPRGAPSQIYVLTVSYSYCPKNSPTNVMGCLNIARIGAGSSMTGHTYTQQRLRYPILPPVVIHDSLALVSLGLFSFHRPQESIIVPIQPLPVLFGNIIHIIFAWLE